ncbi:hypothetical protein OWV82_016607 [Melia azedarach]|uniref:Uncharacterized protein n=1 Tax=Melia azedarach TaxID=155640 RepID=A0ACC1XHJ4_MELAZ|nr:hypothetical protein OWV82_016607 [Melia azedarach]
MLEVESLQAHSIFNIVAQNELLCPHSVTPVQEEDPKNVEPNGPRSKEYATTINGGFSPPRHRHEEKPRDDHEYQCEPRNVVDEEEDEAIEDVSARGYF